MDQAYKKVAPVLLVLVIGCGGEDNSEQVVGNNYALLPYAAEVFEFTPGMGAGFGGDKFPDVVLGPPKGRGKNAGSIDVLSLGVAGEIVLSFAHRPIVDGDGPDFVVFENVFYAGGDQTLPFIELAEVSVSSDGVDWYTFDCNQTATSAWPGCAGWNPTLEFDAALDPLDHAATGGDAFDLAESGLSRVELVRIRDLSDSGDPPSAGFDLDAVGVIND